MHAHDLAVIEPLVGAQIDAAALGGCGRGGDVARAGRGAAAAVTAVSSMVICPAPSIDTWTGSACWSSAPARLSGRSIGTPATSKGAVTMKMISSTSITSTSGVTLISAIGARRERPPRRDEEGRLAPISGRSRPRLRARGSGSSGSGRRSGRAALRAGRGRGSGGCRRSPRGWRRTGRWRWRTAPRRCPARRPRGLVLLAPAMAVKARMMPHTVPNSPTNGATEPTVARMLRRSPRWSSSVATAAFMRLARRSRVPARSTTPPRGRAAPFVEPGGEDRGGGQLLGAADCVEAVDVARRPEVALIGLGLAVDAAQAQRVAEDDRPGPHADAASSPIITALTTMSADMNRVSGDIRSGVGRSVIKFLLSLSRGTPRPTPWAGGGAGRRAREKRR